jgi:hypothetical protein
MFFSIYHKVNQKKQIANMPYIIQEIKKLHIVWFDIFIEQ